MEKVNSLLAKEIERSSKATGETSLSKHDSLVLRYNKAKVRVEGATKAKTEKCVKAKKLEKYLEALDGGQLTEWSGELWLLMVEKAVVGHDGEIEFEFVDGRKVTAFKN